METKGIGCFLRMPTTREIRSWPPCGSAGGDVLVLVYGGSLYHFGKILRTAQDGDVVRPVLPLRAACSVSFCVSPNNTIWNVFVLVGRGWLFALWGCCGVVLLRLRLFLVDCIFLLPTFWFANPLFLLFWLGSDCQGGVLEPSPIDSSAFVQQPKYDNIFEIHDWRVQGRKRFFG